MLTEIVVDIMKEGGVKLLQSAASEIVLDRLMDKAHGLSILIFYGFSQSPRETTDLFPHLFICLCKALRALTFFERPKIVGNIHHHTKA